MYDYFSGTVSGLTPTHVTIDCNGVGYHFQISLFTYSFIKEEKKIKLFAHQVVREDAHLLFGFSGEEERNMFRELLNVSGVGATTARIILSSLNPSELRQVIASGQVQPLQKVKGIGAKTAQRIIVDLQDKMKKGVAISSSLPGIMHNTAHEEALSALLTLGFPRVNAEKALQQAMKSLPGEPQVESLIKSALGYL